MEVGYILHELWRYKRMLALGLIVAALVATATVYHLPSFESKNTSLGTARVQLLVDASSSPVGSLNGPLDEVVVRAGLYARLIESTPVRRRIQQKLGLAGGGGVATEGPQPGQTPAPGNEPNEQQRSADLLTEGNPNRLFASAESDLPLVTIVAQAVNAPAATTLADTAAAALQDYVSEVQSRQKVSPTVQVELRTLGPARGGVVNEGAGYTAAVLGFIGAFLAWCVLILVGARVLRGLREVRMSEGSTDDLLRPNGDGQLLEGLIPPDGYGERSYGSNHEPPDRTSILR